MLPENRGQFSSSVEICRKALPARNFKQPQPSRTLRNRGHGFDIFLTMTYGKLRSRQSYRTVCWSRLPIMNIVHQSEIRVRSYWSVNLNRLKDWRKCSEILAIFSPIFVLQFSGKIATRNFTQIPPHIRTSNSTRHEPKFFHGDALGVGGPQLIYHAARAFLPELFLDLRYCKLVLEDYPMPIVFV